ncbi:hypothetical protein [Amycolatopsis sp. PS_44_ISF1]|uniref:hypothetical protein n=1 Tax=Amycolatopsis sp. PS_44_ISF1 TaxID=2974917 RepID=UPI0028E01F53|nr:hypothetical protein [Amycolatopsis sp. PS_44_ISF1]MDT8915806.1 SprT-like domain-containing protein [Amycolatopsis sp. PS_44_ISF1]
MTAPTQTREMWLHKAIEALRPRFEEVGMPLPEKIHVSVGFGGAARAENKFILAVCWATEASADKANHIFISPVLDDTARILDVLIHELIHAADNCKSGHKGPFAEAATRLGLTGKMTATVASVELAAEMITLAETLGDYPHGKFTAFDHAPAPKPGEEPAPKPKVSSGPSAQGTRMLKLVCPEDGYTVRTTAKWLAVGYPSCPCGAELING